MAPEALAVPETGFYYQPLSGPVVGSLQAVAQDGIIEIDYTPTLNRRLGTNAPMQLLQAAARFPAPILDSPLVIRGLIGYRQQWAYYDGQEDTYGGIDAGLVAMLKLGELPWVGPFVSPVTLHGYGFQNWLVTAKAKGANFSPQGMTLPTFGWGIGYELPNKGRLYAGVESWTIPIEIGSGQQEFSKRLRLFQQIVVGYKW